VQHHVIGAAGKVCQVFKITVPLPGIDGIVFRVADCRPVIVYGVVLPLETPRAGSIALVCLPNVVQGIGIIVAPAVDVERQGSSDVRVYSY